jgi:hypothetical protein
MWELPDLGPIGGHGLANPRDFLFPVAAVDEELQVDWKIVNKMNGTYHQIAQDHTPYDLVAWHGNVIPYKVGLLPTPIFSLLLPFHGPSTQSSVLAALAVANGSSTTSRNSPRRIALQLITPIPASTQSSQPNLETLTRLSQTSYGLDLGTLPPFLPPFSSSFPQSPPTSSLIPSPPAGT